MSTATKKSRMCLPTRYSTFASYSHASLVPRLSPRANEKSKERGEPGRIYHVRNVIGREDLITCGRTNELAQAVRTECSCDSFIADRMGLDSTIDSRVTGIGSSINTSFVILLFYIMPMVNHPG